MKRTRQMIRGAAVILVLAAPGVFAAPIYTGSGEDAFGDVQAAPRATPGNHDIKSAVIEVDASTFFARILFYDGTYRRAAEDGATVVSILLDLDQNKDTGFSGIDSGNNNSEFFGLDAFVTMRPTSKTVARFDEDRDRFSISRDFSDDEFVINELVNGIEVTIARNLLLDGDDGLFNFYIFAQQSLGGSVSTGIVDYLSDVGSPPLQMTRVSEPRSVPEPGTLALFGVGLMGMGLARRRRS